MSEDTSPENLRKFLESNDPGMVRMGLSMAKGSGVPEELLGLVTGLYMWDDDKDVRAAAKSLFMKHAPDELKDILKETWNANYRTITTSEQLWPKVKDIFERSKGTHLGVEMWAPALVRSKGDRSSILQIMGSFGLDAIPLFIKALPNREVGHTLIKIGTPAVEPLIEVMSSDRNVGKAAAQILGEIGDARAIDPLAMALDDDSLDIPLQRVQINALTNIGNSRVVEPLIKALKKPETCYVTAESLGMLGDKRAIKPLVNLLVDENIPNLTSWGSKRVVVKALERLKWKPETGELHVASLIAKRDWKSFTKLPPDLKELAVEPLVKTLPDGAELEVITILGDLGDIRAVEPLINILDNNHYDTPHAAAKVLGKIGDLRAVEPLIKVLDSDNYGLPEVAAEVLGKIGDLRAVEPLIKALDSDDYGLPREAAKALGKIGDLRAVEPLIQSLGSYGTGASEVLVEFGEAAIDPLVKALKHETQSRDSVAASEAAGTLDKLGWKPDAELHVPYLIAKSDWEGCVNLGEPTVIPLIKILEADNWSASVAETLGKIGDLRAVEPLIKAIDKGEERRYDKRLHVAVEALGAIGDLRAVNLLINTLGHVEASVRLASAEVLGKIGDEKTVEKLVQALMDNPSEYVAKALEMLKWKPETDEHRAFFLVAKRDRKGCLDMGEPVVEPLINTLTRQWRGGDEEIQIRRYAVNVLGAIGDTRAIEPLILTLGNPIIHKDAADEIRKFGVAAATNLIKAREGKLTTGSVYQDNISIPQISQAADKLLTIKLLKSILEEKGLSTTGTKTVLLQRLESAKATETKGIKALIKDLENVDTNIRCLAIVALGKLGDRDGVEPLLKIADDKESNIRNAVVKALGEINDSQVIEPLSKALNDSSKKVQLTAIDALGKIGKPGVAPLIAALGNANRDILKAIANALSKIGDAQAIEPLKKIFEEEDSIDVRDVISRTLKNLGHKTTNLDTDSEAENLRRFLTSDDQDMVRMGISMAKGRGVPMDLLGLMAGLYMWHDDSGMRAAAKSVFTKMASEDLQTILKKTWNTGYRTIKTSDALQPKTEKMVQQFKGTIFDNVDLWKPALLRTIGDRISITQVMVNFGEDAVSTLVKALDDDNDHVAGSAAEALGKIESPDAVDSLIKALDDDSYRKVTNSAEALGRIGDVRAIDPLIKVIDDNWQARMALVKFGKVATVHLTAALDSKISDERTREIAETLGEIGDIRALESLIKLLSDQKDDVRSASAKALKNLEWKPDTDELRAAYLISNSDWKKLVEWGETAVEHLIKILEEDSLLPGEQVSLSSYVRKSIVEVLGEIGDSRTLEQLTKLLSDQHSRVRSASAKALEMLKWKPETDEHRTAYLIAKQEWDTCVNMGKSAVETLINMLESDISTIVHVCEALGKIGDTRSVEPLIKMLEHDNWNVGDNAALALGIIGDKRAVEPLIKVLDGDYVNNGAVQALGEIGDVRAIEPLTKILLNVNQNWKALTYAVRALEEIGEPAQDSLVMILEAGPATGIAQSSAEALDRLGWEPVTDEHRTSYLIANNDWKGFVKWGKPAVNQLIKALEHNNENVQVKAIETLGKIRDTRAIEPLIKKVKGGSYHAANTLKKFGLQGLEGIVTAGEYSVLTGDELKMLARQKKLSTSGKKAVLIQRLKGITKDT